MDSLELVSRTSPRDGLQQARQSKGEHHHFIRRQEGRQEDCVLMKTYDCVPQFRDYRSTNMIRTI